MGRKYRFGVTKQVYRHGASTSKAYRAWIAMLGRCYDPKDCRSANYQGRGIKVCDRWQKSFENFLADMGEPPSGMTLDRINNDGDYEPNNCRWADRRTQSRNRSSARPLTLGGKTQLLTDWARELGMAVPSLKRRLDQWKWPLERALTEKPRRWHERKV